MLPRITKIENGKVHINDEIVTDNLFLHRNGFELIEKAPGIAQKDFERMLLHEPEIAIFGVGFRGRVRLEDTIMDAAKKQNITVHILPSEDAIRKFQELARKGEKVVAHIHVNE